MGYRYTSREMMITRMSGQSSRAATSCTILCVQPLETRCRCRWRMFLEWPFRYNVAQPGLSVSEDLSKLCESMTQSSEGSRDSEAGGGRNCRVSALKQFSSSVFQRRWLCGMPIGTAVALDELQRKLSSMLSSMT